MSSILTRGRGEATGESEDTARESVMEVLKVALKESGTDASSAARGRKIARAFLVIDVEAAVRRLLGGRRASSGAVEALAEPTAEFDGDRGSQGRGTLSKLFLVGVIVGLGYVLRTRSGSVGKVVDTATERAQSVADETARRSGEVAQRTTAVTGQVADRIEESGQTAAERVEQTGQMAAERIEGGGEMATDRIEEATETVEEMEEGATSEGEEGEETEE